MYPSAQQPQSMYPGQQLPSYQNPAQAPGSAPQVSVTYPMQPGGAEDLNNPRYRCLCQKVHVVLGAKIIGIVEVVCVALSFFSIFQGKKNIALEFGGW